MQRLQFSLDDFQNRFRTLFRILKSEKGKFRLRDFPDGETYLRVLSKCAGRDVDLLVELSHPNLKLAPLLFLADALRDQGARSVRILAPYLPYLRQDKAFHPGEAITSRSFAKLLSERFDGLVTVAPHLHRYHSLAEIYSIPTRIAPAEPAIARWIQHSVKNPLLIGPDQESRQWVSQIAKEAGAPFVVLAKKRHSDRKVSISVSDLKAWKMHRPILVDDIISTGHTMIETIRQLKLSGLRSPICIGVHALFVERAYAELRKAGAAKIVTCNTIVHASNAIDLSVPMAEAMESLIEKAAP